MGRKKLSRAKRKTVADFLKNQVGLSRRKVRDLFREEKNLEFVRQKEEDDLKAELAFKKDKFKKTIVVGKRYFKLSPNEGVLASEKKEITFRERDTIVSFLRSKGFTYIWIGEVLGMNPAAVKMSMKSARANKNKENKKSC